MTFELIEDLTNKGLILKNVILWINNFEKINPLITNNYKSILFFVKSDKYFFDKDPVREKHIWKDIEWGKFDANSKELEVALSLCRYTFSRKLKR